MTLHIVQINEFFFIYFDQSLTYLDYSVIKGYFFTSRIRGFFLEIQNFRKKNILILTTISFSFVIAETHFYSQKFTTEHVKLF